MVKKIKNIYNLTKIFFKSSFQNPYLINKENNKINWKSPYVWLLIILAITMSYFSMEILKYLLEIGQEIIFLNVFFLIFAIIFAFNIILASTNTYVFSKDLELVIPLPIKQDEILIAKFNVLLLNLYFFEIIFMLFPLLIYGIYTSSGILYYLDLIIVIRDRFCN